MLTLAALVDHLAGNHVYRGVFGLLLLGSLGVPIPEEVPIIAAGILSRAHFARWWLALPVCLLGVLSGDVILYWIGRHWGERVLGWRPVRWVLSPEREQWFKDAYHRHAGKTIVLARHIMGIRAAAFLTAGIARVPFLRFLVADAGAVLLGIPFSFGLAYVFADQVEAIVMGMHRVERWLVAGGVLVLLGIGAALARRSAHHIDINARRRAGEERSEG